MQILPAGHWLFQIAQIFLLLSYLATNLIALRGMLACAALFFALWAGLILNISLDTLIWNVVFGIINTAQMCLLLYQKRPIAFRYPAHEQIYQEVFAKVGISRHDFRAMADIGLLRSLKEGSYYIEAGNVVNNLSLLYKGKLELYQRHHNRPQTINGVMEWEFVESPEWAARKNRRKDSQPPPSPRKHSVPDGCALLEFQDAETIKVSVKAVENCYFLTWPVEQLEAFLDEHPNVSAPFSAIVGADIATKLFRQHPSSLQKKLELSQDELFLFNLFQERVAGFAKMDALELVTTGRSACFHLQGTVFVRAGEHATQLAVLKSGEMEAVYGAGTSQEKVMYVIQPPQFLAAVEFEADDHIARLTIRSRTPCTFCVWDAEALRELCAAHVSIHHVLSSVLAADLSAKLMYGLGPPGSVRERETTSQLARESETPTSQIQLLSPNQSRDLEIVVCPNLLESHLENRYDASVREEKQVFP